MSPKTWGPDPEIERRRRRQSTRDAVAAVLGDSFGDEVMDRLDRHDLAIVRIPRGERTFDDPPPGRRVDTAWLRDVAETCVASGGGRSAAGDALAAAADEIDRLRHRPIPPPTTDPEDAPS